VGRRFSNLPKSNPFQSSPVLSIHVPSWLSCVLLEFFIVLSRYFDILVYDYLISAEIPLNCLKLFDLVSHGILGILAEQTEA